MGGVAAACTNTGGGGGGGRAYMVVDTPRPAPNEVPCECEFSMFILHLQ